MQRVVNLGVMALSELLGGFTFSLLSPFYTQEATDKGMTVAQTGLVSELNLFCGNCVIYYKNN